MFPGDKYQCTRWKCPNQWPHKYEGHASGHPGNAAYPRAPHCDRLTVVYTGRIDIQYDLYCKTGRGMPNTIWNGTEHKRKLTVIARP